MPFINVQPRGRQEVYASGSVNGAAFKVPLRRDINVTDRLAEQLTALGYTYTAAINSADSFIYDTAGTIASDTAAKPPTTAQATVGGHKEQIPFPAGDTSVDVRSAIQLLFNASSTGKVVQNVAAGKYILRSQVFSGGMWAGAGIRLKITGRVSGKVSYSALINGNSDIPVVLSELSDLQMEMGAAAPFGVYAMLAPASKPDQLDPPAYFRNVVDSGITATSFTDPASTKLRVGPYDYYIDSVGAPYSVQRAYSKDQGDLNHLRFETAPGDIPPAHNENDRAEAKAEYSNTDQHNCAPFNTPISWTQDILFEPGPQKIGSFGVYGQWHATEDNPTMTPGRVQDQFLSPPFACYMQAPFDTFSIETRTSPNAAQVNGNYPPTVHFTESNFARGVWHRFYFEIMFNFTGQAFLRVWRAIGTGPFVQIVSAENISIGYNDVYGPHFAFGTYSAGVGTPTFPYTPEVTRQAVQYANLDMWVGQLMRSRITSPSPILLTPERQF